MFSWPRHICRNATSGNVQRRVFAVRFLLSLAVSGGLAGLGYMASTPSLLAATSRFVHPITVPTDDFSKAERYEAMAGGAGTFTGTAERNAFSQPADNVSFGERARFNIGNAIFRRPWVSAPSSTKSADGLGPLFNARACQHCHLKDGRGHPPAANFPDDDAISMLMRISVPPRSDAERQRLADGTVASIPDPVYGGQVQDLAVQGLQPEAKIHTIWHEETVTLGDGTTVSLRHPEYSLDHLAYGPHDPELMMSVRMATPMIGLGLLEAVPDETILALADPDDADGDGISGRPNRVWSNVEQRFGLGRFGWKATQLSLMDQNADAFNGDIGMSSFARHAAYGDCTEAQADCRNAPHGDTLADDTPGPEITDELMEQLLFYTRSLAVPVRRNVQHPDVLRGKKLFYEARCTGCHNPKFVTRDDAAEAIFSHQLIWPYTDMLLHDMGEGLSDNRPVAQASGQEWRTPPLWGIGLTEAVSDHTYFLHDGRARNLTEAILWHGGEAQGPRDAFAAMSADDRAALLLFLNSL